jgi:hypothetical protein
MIDRSLQSTLIVRADVMDIIRGISLAHIETMRYVPVSPETTAFSEGYYSALKALCLGLNLNDSQVPRLRPEPRPELVEGLIEGLVRGDGL